MEVQSPIGPVSAWRVGPAVLLVHGWEDDNALWGPMIDRLQTFGRAAVVLDLPGHGYSRADFCGPEELAQALLSVAEALGPIEAVVGHSFGCVALTAGLAAGLAAQRAVLIASPIPDARRRLDREQGRNAPADVRARAQELILLEENSRPSFDYLGATATMKAQALIIHSLDDEQCPPSNAQTLADLWPQSALVWMDGLGHRLIAQDKATTERTAEFVEGLGQGA
jgi:pimeloyl-ACP methyl ester carboxylesterase